MARTIAGERKRPSKWMRVVDIAGWAILIGVFVMLAALWGPTLLVEYGLVSKEAMIGFFKVRMEGNQPTPFPTPTAGTTTFGGGGGGGTQPVILGGSLPDCTTVTDTTTLCQGTPGTMPGGGEEAEPQPTDTPAPAYTQACLTPPGERPCWLAPDQPWEPLAEVPATPLVLLPEPTGVPLIFADSACAAWHPPLPWPEGCDE